MSVSDFSAQEPALGYYYQILYGLYLLSKQGVNTSSSLKLETLDDISIETPNSTNLYQTKLHIRNHNNLSERSSDFWKTIRVWSEGIINNAITAEHTFFNLITTQSISEGTFLEDFKPTEKKDAFKILKKMEEIASEHTNESNRLAYNSFNALSKEQKEGLIKNIIILDSSLDIEETIAKTRNSVRLSAPPDRLDDFFDELMGWWFQKSIEILCNKVDQISFRQLHLKIQYIRDKYKLGGLPEDFPNSIDVSDEELESCHKENYVKQLSIIDIGKSAKRTAISDYKRAYSQRSRWLRDELIITDELETYDQMIHDDWKRGFDFIQDDSEGNTDEAKAAKGKEFYRSHYSKESLIKFRGSFQPAYMEKGSIHILSNNLKIGWHPDYKAKLNQRNEELE